MLKANFYRSPVAVFIPEFDYASVLIGFHADGASELHVLGEGAWFGAGVLIAGEFGGAYVAIVWGGYGSDAELVGLCLV